MFTDNNTIHPIERILLLLADPLINAVWLYLPLLLILSPLYFFGWITHYAFLKCNCFLLAATYLNKDIAGGKSLGKRFLGYAVVNENNGRPRRAVCFLRNITFLIYPAELILGLFSPKQKILDYFTKTKLIKTPKDPHPISSFYNEMKNIPYDDETREVLGLTVLLFLLVLFLN